MSQTVQDYFFSGQGRVFLAEIDGTTKQPKGFIHVGNAPVCKLSLSTETEDITESMSGNQLLVKRIPRKKGAELTLNITNWDKRNLGIALYGEVDDVTGGTVTAEELTAYLGTNIPLAHPGVSTVVVKGTGLASGITYTLGKNYTVDAQYGSIYIMSTAEQSAASATDVIANADTISIGYTYASYSKTKAFASAAKEYQLRLEGVNTAETGDKFLVTVWRFAPKPIADWNLISDETGPIDISGAALADTARAEGDQFLTQIRM